MQTLLDQLHHDLFGGAELAERVLPGSLALFAPELILCATILIILTVRVFRRPRFFDDAFVLALVGVGTALYFALPPGGFATAGEIHAQEIFSGLLIYDTLTIYIRCLLLFFAVLFILLTKLTGLVTMEDSPDILCLVLGATLGFCVMASANHLLTVFMGVEMASVPSYVMAGILKGRPRSSEAALKYAVYGAGAAGIMLYGISLLCGVLGSAHLPTLAGQLIDLDLPHRLATGEGSQTVLILALGGLMVMVGLAFKLSAVPFHFWCPDVFEGAPAEVGAFLSVASKAAALALLVRLAVGFGYVNPAEAPPEPSTMLAAVSISSESNANTATPDVMLVADEQHDAPASDTAALAPVRTYIALLLAFVAAITCTFGNLAAYGQTNIKRMLAYSTIAHAGYMIMPVAAALALAATEPALARQAIAALLFYITIYLFMNLGAFAIVAFLRNKIGSEEIADYAGLVRTAPFTVVCFTVILFSLVGIPPFAGFLGKAWIFLSLIQAWNKVGSIVMITLLVIAGLNTAISLVYYLRVAKVMAIDPPAETSQATSGLPFLPATYVALVSAPMIVLFVWSNDVYHWALQATSHLFS